MDLSAIVVNSVYRHFVGNQIFHLQFLKDLKDLKEQGVIIHLSLLKVVVEVRKKRITANL